MDHILISSIIIIIFIGCNFPIAVHSVNSEQPVVDVSPFIRIYKNGSVERLIGKQTVPPSLDPITNVDSKDILYSPHTTTLFARLYLPKNTPQQETHKLPLLVHFHGGGFLVGNASDPALHEFLNLLVSEAKIIAVSVHYRLAPEHPVPAAYDDSWTALQWVASHSNQKGPEHWLNHYADFKRVYLSGDSAGANIAHQMAIKHGRKDQKLEGVDNFEGIILCHPYFWGSHRVAGESSATYESNKAWGGLMWRVACPKSSGVDDPWMNPAKDPNLEKLGCNRVQVFVSEKDYLRERGWYYAQKLRESGWRGDMEVVDYSGEVHDFFFANLSSKNSVDLRHRILSFIINH